MQWLLTYGACLITLLLLDVAWITLVARKVYDAEAGEVIREKPQLFAGLLFYLIYAAGISAFAVLPLTRHFNGIHATLPTYRDVAAWGAGLGLFAYATFGLTNQAVIKQWNYKLVAGDLLWGAILTALASLVGFGVFRAFT